MCQVQQIRFFLVQNSYAQGDSQSLFGMRLKQWDNETPLPIHKSNTSCYSAISLYYKLNGLFFCYNI